jgi:hypothetical protein
MKHSNLYLGLVLPSGGWQSLIDNWLSQQVIESKKQIKKTSKTTEALENLIWGIKSTGIRIWWLVNNLHN